MREPVAATYCPSCQQLRSPEHIHDSAIVPEVIIQAMQAEHPQWNPEEGICEVCMEKGKSLYLQGMVETEMGGVTDLEAEVLASIRDDRLLSENENETFDRQVTQADNVSSWVSRFVGSWYFPTLIGLFLIFWVLSNWLFRPFQPYPMIIFGVLSAFLASLAALHGPFIIMSQRDQQKRDRLRAENDYQINLKAELEIQYLTEQVAQLLLTQEKLMQEVQALKVEGETEEVA